MLSRDFCVRLANFKADNIVVGCFYARHTNSIAGVTNAGKTYTVTGIPEDTGVLPRALDVIFNSIENHAVQKPKVKPHCFSDVCTMSAADVTDMTLLKESIFDGTSAPPVR